MTEPARYPRSVFSVVLRVVVFCALAAGITWFVAPFDWKKTFATTQPSAKPLAAPTRVTAVAKPASRPAFIRQIASKDGGRWAVYSDGALMHADASGSNLDLDFQANLLLVPDIAPLFKARMDAVRTHPDPSAHLTNDQIRRLRAVHWAAAPAASDDDRQRMRQAWVEYQQALANPAATVATKAAAETKVTQLLAQIAAGPRDVERQRYINAASQIQQILTPDQVSALTRPRPTTRRQRNAP